jgi:hypothetical protein
MPAACPEVRSAAERYLASRGLSVTPHRDGGLAFSGDRVKDGRGHRIRVTLSALRRYAHDAPKKLFYPANLSWLTYSQFELDGQLRLDLKGSQCEVSIKHRYSVFAAIWLIAIPIDSDSVDYDGNGLLEAQYLSGLEAALRKPR